MTNKLKWPGEEVAALAALADARRARLRLGRVEVREPKRPEPKPALATLADMVAAEPAGAGHA